MHRHRSFPLPRRPSIAGFVIVLLLGPIYVGSGGYMLLRSARASVLVHPENPDIYYFPSV